MVQRNLWMISDGAYATIGECLGLRRFGVSTSPPCRSCACIVWIFPLNITVCVYTMQIEVGRHAGPSAERLKPNLAKLPAPGITVTLPFVGASPYLNVLTQTTSTTINHTARRCESSLSFDLWFLTTVMVLSSCEGYALADRRAPLNIEEKVTQ